MRVITMETIVYLDKYNILLFMKGLCCSNCNDHNAYHNADAEQ